MRPRIVNFLVFIYLSVEKGTCSFSVLRTGAITKRRNTKDWKDTEQQQHHNTEAHQEWFPQHQETSTQWGIIQTMHLKWFSVPIIS